MSQTVLIIESEPWLGDQYQQRLERSDFAVLRSSNAYTAIDMIDQHSPGVIIMSLLLNGPGAVGLLHELQSYVDTAKISVIVCSSLPNLQLDELRPYGVVRLIDTTTMQPSDIPAAVRSVLS
jgi:chemotaxis family two-component system response regulator PixH